MLLQLDISNKDLNALRKRAARADMSLPGYVLAAALDPLKYAWLEDGFVMPPLRRRRTRK